MPLISAIYGFQITKAFTVCGLQFLPAIQTLPEAGSAARDQTQYNLTAVVMAESFPGDVLFRLEAVLSFIEHLDVVITEPQQLTHGDPLNQFDKTLRLSRRNSGGGAIIGNDTFFPASRPRFIELALTRLADTAHCEATGYRTLFFKVTEAFRQRRPLIEVSYFLMFSGLETYVRKTLNDFDSRDVAQLLARRLRAMGFNIYNFSQSQAERSTDTYARLRNALFHNSAFEATRNSAGTTTTYQLTNFFGQFSILMSLLVVKATDFDDGHLNWDAWIDRQLLK